MAVVNFLGHGSVSYDGSGDKLREHGYIEEQVGIVSLSGRFVAVYVDEI